MGVGGEEKKRSVAFIGTDLMGRPMARRLLGAGFSVAVWNRSVEKAEALVADGAVLADRRPKPPWVPISSSPC